MVLFSALCDSPYSSGIILFVLVLSSSQCVGIRNVTLPISCVLLRWYVIVKCTGNHIQAVLTQDDSMDATNGVPERKARVGSISPERRPQSSGRLQVESCWSSCFGSNSALCKCAQATSSGLVTKGGGLTVPAPTSAAVMQPHNYSPKVAKQCPCHSGIRPPRY
eukprot:4655897-Amphidinium_carterae.1